MMMNLGRILGFIIFILGLSGCEDENNPNTINKSSTAQHIAASLHDLPPVVIEDIIVPKSKPKSVEIKIPEVQFPDSAPLLREEQVRQLRGLRQSLHKNKLAYKKQIRPKREYDYQDEDYQRWASVSEDKSTFPVDRSRIITADMRINGILEDNINSQIAGKVIVIIDKELLSSNGRYILLPSYTKLICVYEEISQNGQTRIPLSCTRALRPDGVSISLTGAMGADQIGRTGLSGKLDNKTFEKYGAAFIVAGLSALSQTAVSRSPNPGVQNATNALSTNLGQVTSEVIKQNINLTPVLTIAAGTKIQIHPTTDIVLRKPLLKDENHVMD